MTTSHKTLPHSATLVEKARSQSGSYYVFESKARTVLARRQWTSAKCSTEYQAVHKKVKEYINNIDSGARLVEWTVRIRHQRS